MAHMELEVDFFKAYNVMDTSGSYTIVPADVVPGAITVEKPLVAFQQYVDGNPCALELIEGWFARYSAEGYLDCTDWVGPCDSAEQAAKECKDIFGDDEDQHALRLGEFVDE